MSYPENVLRFWRDLRESMPDPYAAIYCATGHPHRWRNRLFRRPICLRCEETR